MSRLGGPSDPSDTPSRSNMKSKTTKKRAAKSDSEDEELPSLNNIKGSKPDRSQTVTADEDDMDVDGDSGADDNNEEDEEIFEVEEVLGHIYTGKKLLYHIKWKGYGLADCTYEPPENVEPSAPDVMAAYYKLIGGVPQPGTEYGKVLPKQTKKGAKKSEDSQSTVDGFEPSKPTKKSARKGSESTESTVDSIPSDKKQPNKTSASAKRKAKESQAKDMPPPSKKTKQARTSFSETSGSDPDDIPSSAARSKSKSNQRESWMPPASWNWEKEVNEIVTIEKDKRTEILKMSVKWKNGKNSTINNELMREKCPQKLLDFYEKHLSVNQSE